MTNRADSLKSGFGGRLPHTVNGHVHNSSVGRTDEFGQVRPESSGGIPRSGSGLISATPLAQRPSTADADLSSHSYSGSPSVSRRPRQSTLGQTNRFTIVNAGEDEIPEDEGVAARLHRSAPSQSISPRQPTSSFSAVAGPAQVSQTPTASSRPAWPSAEEEKARLYQQAKADVERVQGGLQRTLSSKVRVAHSRILPCIIHVVAGAVVA